MGVNDYGAATSPLDAPPLGGPGGWAESVSAVLDGSDETVDSRIAVATADLGARITRPNVDDRLVEQWNGTAWSVVDYDSGWRDIASSLLNGWTTSAGGFIRVRRRNNQVTYRISYGGLDGRTATSNTFLNPESAVGYGFCAEGEGRTLWHRGPGALVTNSYYYQSSWYAPGFGTSNDLYSPYQLNELTFDVTDPGIPTSLPGTLVSPAPQ